MANIPSHLCLEPLKFDLEVKLLMIHNVQGCPGFARIAGRGTWHAGGMPIAPTHKRKKSNTDPHAEQNGYLHAIWVSLNTGLDSPLQHGTGIWDWIIELECHAILCTCLEDQRLNQAYCDSDRFQVSPFGVL